MKLISKDSILAAQAKQGFTNKYGRRIEDVMGDEDWAVAVVNGQAEVVYSQNGSVAMARLVVDPEDAYWMTKTRFEEIERCSK